MLEGYSLGDADPRRTDRPPETFPRPDPDGLTRPRSIHADHADLPSLPVERLLEVAARHRQRRAGGAGRASPRRARPLPGRKRLAASGRATPILHVARDGTRLATLEEALRFFAPDIEVLSFPAWDGVPYDRVAPNAETIASRIATLAELAGRAPDAAKPLIVLTTVNAILQRVPPRDFIAGSSLKLQPGNTMSMQALIERLEMSGYARAGTVTDPGQYAVRGGILDLYPPGGEPVRLDFFGDTLEQVRAFDPNHPAHRVAARSRPASADERADAHARSAQRLPPALCRAVRPGHRRRPALRVRSRPAASIRAWSIGCRCSMTASPRCSTICRAPPSRSTRWSTTPGRDGWSRSPTITMRGRKRSSARRSARRLIIRCRPTACS